MTNEQRERLDHMLSQVGEIVRGLEHHLADGKVYIKTKYVTDVAYVYFRIEESGKVVKITKNDYINSKEGLK